MAAHQGVVRVVQLNHLGNSKKISYRNYFSLFVVFFLPPLTLRPDRVARIARL